MKLSNIVITSIILLLFVSCKKYKQTNLNNWTEETHGIHFPNYNQFFDKDEIHTIEIKLSEQHWSKIINDLEINHIDINTGPNQNNEKESITQSLPKLNYFPSSLTYNGIEWYKVGFRFKGLSSQNESWSKNILKMPIKIDFNSFGNIFEGIENQRYYGFEKMTFANNFRDPSQIREKIAYELMASFGVKVPKTNFAEVYIDNEKNGKKYFGLYTMIETIEDGMIQNEFGTTIGNCYKPTGRTATLVENQINSFDLNQKTNKGSSIDDVLKLSKVLQQKNRKNNPESWRNDLEEIFEVNNFLKYLSANTVIQNWDAYGISSRNYYLYTKPSNGKIVFIPWDLSESFDLDGKISPHLLDHSNVTNNWPLIKYLIADSVYFQIYKSYVQDFNENYFVPSKLENRIDELFSLIEASIIKEEIGYKHHLNMLEVTDYIQHLKTQINNRHNEVQSFYL